MKQSEAIENARSLTISEGEASEAIIDLISGGINKKSSKLNGEAILNQSHKIAESINKTNGEPVSEVSEAINKVNSEAILNQSHKMAEPINKTSGEPVGEAINKISSEIIGKAIENAL